MLPQPVCSVVTARNNRRSNHPLKSNYNVLRDIVGVARRRCPVTRVHSAKFNNRGFRWEEALQNNMFPLCLINASVTDAEGIRSRLVSFPPTLFSSVCHIAFPMVLLKKQAGSAFPVFLDLLGCYCFCLFFGGSLSSTPRRLFSFFFLLSQIDLGYKLKCQTAQPGTVKQKAFLCGAIRFTSLLWLALVFF